jgi:hypothetical protein
MNATFLLRSICHHVADARINTLPYVGDSHRDGTSRYYRGRFWESYLLLYGILSSASQRERRQAGRFIRERLEEHREAREAAARRKDLSCNTAGTAHPQVATREAPPAESVDGNSQAGVSRALAIVSSPALAARLEERPSNPARALEVAGLGVAA